MGTAIAYFLDKIMHAQIYTSKSISREPLTMLTGSRTYILSTILHLVQWLQIVNWHRMCTQTHDPEQVKWEVTAQFAPMDGLRLPACKQQWSNVWTKITKCVLSIRFGLYKLQTFFSLLGVKRGHKSYNSNISFWI